MRIQVVKASAFGPFLGDALELAPGMNVVYGPNESGKSSWHAAIYAALCGMRTTRGMPTKEDRTFTNRHRPWGGRPWRVSIVIALDDGRTVDIERSFGAGGRGVATDRSTKKPLAGDIVRSGTIDGATLLGLSRETALATIFVRQADVLRVLTDASELQEYLERAAATSTADTTADESLTGIAAYRRDCVGLTRVGSRGPLATSSNQLRGARENLDKAEEGFETYQAMLSRRNTTETEAREAEQRLREVEAHENERQRRERWREIRTAERRVEQARRLAAEVASAPPTSGPQKDLVLAVTRALAAFEARPAEPDPLQGAAAVELEKELAEVPAMPIGDFEPAREVTSLMNDWRTESQRLAAHDEIEPVKGETIGSLAPPSELRRLADDLELPIPAIDPALVAEVDRRRAIASVPPPPTAAYSHPRARGPKPSSSGQSRIQIVVGCFFVLLGSALAALSRPVVGSVVVLMGVIVAAVGALRAARTKRPSAPIQWRAPIPEHQASPPPDLELSRLEIRLALQQESQAQAQRRCASAVARVAELGLPADAGALRQLGIDGDTAGSADARHSLWQRRRSELHQSLSTASDKLRVALPVNEVTIGNDGLEEAFDDYVDACRRRAEIARKAARRTDLEAQLVSRRAAEASQDQDVAARGSAERQLLYVARQTGCHAESVDALADALREWARSEGELDESRQHHAKTAARLDQLLDGKSLEELDDELRDLTADAGDPPSNDDTTLGDRSGELDALHLRARQRRDALAELVGQIEGAESPLLDVSQAIEAEARASAEVQRLEALAEDLDLASEILSAAQKKVHADIAPVLNATIRPWVPRITRGRYDDIRVNPATLEVEAHETGGQYRSATLLSHGTTEQLFLLLRLALAERLATTGEKAPLILDDITAQSDADRTVAALELLHELTAQHQVVMFSQEEEVLRWAETQLRPPNDRLIRLNAPK